MNIAVLFTGGTIGSTLAGDVIGTKTGAADGLLDTIILRSVWAIS